MKLSIQDAPFLLELEVCIGITLGAITFLLVDLYPMDDIAMRLGQKHPPIREMIVVMLLWGALFSGSLILGSLVMIGGTFSFVSATLFAFVFMEILLCNPAICWNLRVLYRKIQK